MNERTSEILRKTKETDIALRLNLDGCGNAEIRTGILFFDHMLTSWAYHSKFDLTIQATGDTLMGPHHMVEDVGLALGSAFKEAIGNGRGITRFGNVVIPMDEAKADVCVDIGGRSYLVFTGTFTFPLEGNIEPPLIRHFFESFTTKAQITMHMSVFGENEHHKAEALFKACGVALSRGVCIVDARIPSTKGVF